MNKNKKIGLVVGVIIGLVGAFYMGMVYGGNNVRSAINSRGAFGQNGANGMMGGNRVGGRGMTGGFTIGQIISKDATSITVQLMTPGGAASGTAAGSKIVFLDNNTKVTKQASGTLADLAVGTEVSVTGTTNSDGSVTAQSVQIRPQVPATSVKQ